MVHDAVTLNVAHPTDKSVTLPHLPGLPRLQKKWGDVESHRVRRLGYPHQTADPSRLVERVNLVAWHAASKTVDRPSTRAQEFRCKEEKRFWARSKVNKLRHRAASPSPTAVGIRAGDCGSKGEHSPRPGCAGRRIRHLRPVQIATAGRLNSPPEAGEFATPDRRHRAVRRGRTVADKQLYLARRETVN